MRVVLAIPRESNRSLNLSFEQVHLGRLLGKNDAKHDRDALIAAWRKVERALPPGPLRRPASPGLVANPSPRNPTDTRRVRPHQFDRPAATASWPQPAAMSMPRRCRTVLGSP